MKPGLVKARMASRTRRAGRCGLLVVISAPSGCGKTTLVNALLAKHRRRVRSVSVTTRKPRAGEVEGSDYIFVSPSEFRRKIHEGEFLEWARVFGQYYGTPREGVRRELERGRDVILAIDVHGAREIRRKADAVTIFVMPPSMKDLEVRLRKRRSDSVSEIRKRLERARMEIACAKDYDYIVPNRNLRAAVRMLTRILEKEKRMRTDEKGG